MKTLKPSQILSHLKTLKPQGDAAFSARYVGAVGHEDRAKDEQSRLKFLGLKMPQVDEVYRLIDFSQLKLSQLLSACLKSKHHEELCILLALLEELDSKSPFKLRELEPFIACIDNWASSDSLSSVMARAFERDFKAGMPFFKKWNKSKNPWMRRQSLVGMYYYAGQRERYPDTNFVLAQVEALLDDPHFYVQKGVGWTLREHYNVNPKSQLQFVRKNLKRISSTAWFATGEKYPVALRKELVLARRNKN